MLIEQYDAICKKLLSEKMVLAWILKETVDEFRNYDISYIVNNCLEKGEGSRIIGMNTESTNVTEGDIRYDFCFKAKGENGEVIVDVEAQNYTSAVTYPLIKRASYYCARLISSQKNTEFSGMDYGKIKKVYSIWINFGVKKEYENVISRFYIMQMHSNGKKMYEEKDYSILEIIFLSLEKEGYYTDNKLLKMLNVIFSHNLKFTEKNAILKAEYGFELEDEKECDTMCNFGEAIYEDGIEKGIEKGKIEGKIEARCEALKSIMENLNCSLLNALDILGIKDVDERLELERIILSN